MLPMLSISRRTFVARAAAGAAVFALPGGAQASAPPRADAERERLAGWLRVLRAEGYTLRAAPLGPAVARAGTLALGTPYLAHTLEAYLAGGGDPAEEPLALRLTVFDCVTLVEAAVAAARTAAAGPGAGWTHFAAEVERMRYRGGIRAGYASRLHYFSEWIGDGARRGLVRDLGPELGAVADLRPLRFMSAHRGSYAALADQNTFRAVALHERSLDGVPRHRVPRARVAAISPRLQSGDVLAFATGIEGLDVTHTGLAHRDARGVLRVLHAPLSGGVVELSPGTLAQYVDALRGCTGILAARPLPA
jgi:hypothetical protein